MKRSVDVVIPTYNSARYLKAAIRSVLLQGDLVRNLFVIDDGSTDRTGDIVKSLMKNNPHMQYIRQANKGLSAARNHGIRLCTASYIAFLDSDDVWHKNKLNAQLVQFRKTKYRNVGLVYCEYDDINPEGQRLVEYGSFRLHKDIRGDVSQELLECNYATGSGSGVLVKRSCFKSVGVFDEKLGACEDWDMWMRIAQKYAFDYVNKPLVSLRRHKKSMQAQTRLMTTNTAILISKMMRTGLPVSKRVKDQTKREILRYIIEHPWDLNFLRKIWGKTKSEESSFVVWNSLGEFIRDFGTVVYQRSERIIYFLAKPFLWHVIPPIKTYIVKPLQRIIQNTKKEKPWQ